MRIASARTTGDSKELLIGRALMRASLAYDDDRWIRSEIVGEFLRSLPAVRALDLCELHDGATSSELRRRCLLLAVEVAFARGTLDDGAIIDAIQQALGVSDRDAVLCAHVLRLRYGRHR